MNITRDRAFYRSLIALTLSIALQNLLAYSVNLADNVMLGAYSQTALSGSALCNQIQFLLQMMVSGAAEGVVVLGSQYWGRKQIGAIPPIVGAAMRFGLLLSALLFSAALAFPAQCLRLITPEADVIAEGAKYLRIVCFTYCIFAMTQILLAALRAIGIVRIGYVISLSTLIINVGLNSLLIFGRMGCPELGIRGAAVATLISRCVELGIVVLYICFREHRLNLTIRKLAVPNRSFVRDYYHTTTPMFLNQAQWGLAQLVQTAVLGHLGEAAIAANSVATIVFQVVSVIVYGAASASGMLIGRTIGAGRQEALRPMVHALLLIFSLNGLAAGTTIYLVRRFVLSFYTLTPEAHQLAIQFMTILSVTVIGTSIQMATDSGIIRGGGDTRFSARMNFFSMWFIVIPGAVLAAFVFHAPAVWVFFLLKWDQLYKILPVMIHLHKWKWPKVLVRAHPEAAEPTNE